LLAVWVISCFWRPLELPTKHLVTAAKSIEYALLAPRSCCSSGALSTSIVFLAVFVAWAVAAGLWGALMFFGIVDDPRAPRPGQREVSFLGTRISGGFTGAALALGFAAIVLGVHRTAYAIAAVIGG